MNTKVTRPGHMVPGWRVLTDELTPYDYEREERTGRRLVAIACVCTIVAVAAGVYAIAWAVGQIIAQ